MNFYLSFTMTNQISEIKTTHLDFFIDFISFIDGNFPAWN